MASVDPVPGPGVSFWSGTSHHRVASLGNGSVSLLPTITERLTTAPTEKRDRQTQGMSP
jgi:hypothetical protein